MKHIKVEVEELVDHTINNIYTALENKTVYQMMFDIPASAGYPPGSEMMINLLSPADLDMVIRFENCEQKPISRDELLSRVVDNDHIRLRLGACYDALEKVLGESPTEFISPRIRANDRLVDVHVGSLMLMMIVEIGINLSTFKPKGSK